MAYNQRKYQLIKNGLARVGEDADGASVVEFDGEVLDPGTYWVLREEDVLGAASLWAYVHNGRMLLDMDVKYMLLSAEQREHLESVIDTAATMAAQWEQTFQKIPD